MRHWPGVILVFATNLYIVACIFFFFFVVDSSAVKRSRFVPLKPRGKRSRVMETCQTCQINKKKDPSGGIFLWFFFYSVASKRFRSSNRRTRLVGARAREPQTSTFLSVRIVPRLKFKFRISLSAVQKNPRIFVLDGKKMFWIFL